MNVKRILLAVVPLGAIAGLAAIVNTRYQGSFWMVFGIVVAAILVNGLIITIEDEQPGGWNNPHGTYTPKYSNTINAAGKVVRWSTAAACAALAVMFAGLVFKYPDNAKRTFTVGIAVLCLSAALLMLQRRRPAIGFAVFGVAALILSAILR